MMPAFLLLPLLLLPPAVLLSWLVAVAPFVNTVLLLVVLIGVWRLRRAS